MKNKLINKLFSSILAVSVVIAGMPLPAGTATLAENTNTQPEKSDSILVKEKNYESGVLAEKWVDKNENEFVPDLVPEYGDCFGFIPEKYDLRDYNRVPDKIRDQGSTGSCWAHAGLCSVESSMITKGLCGTDIDLSEAHLAYFTYCRYSEDPEDVFYHLGDNMGINKGYNAAGNPKTVLYSLICGIGPALETEENYITFKPEFDEDQRYNSVAAVKNFQEYSSYDTTAIKSAIMEYGAVTLGLGLPISKHSAAIYNPAINHEGHEVAVIGWDDNYQKENFSSVPENQPPEDGAWLCRNSWGDNANDNGYFWLSYNNADMYNISSFEMEEKDYEQIYQYDLEYSMAFLPSQTTQGTVIGNVFTADSNEAINAVSFITLAADTPYTIIIRSDVEKGKPVSGNVLLVQDGFSQYTGYHKTDLDKQIFIEKGTTFSVSIMLSKGRDLGPAALNRNIGFDNSFFGHFNLNDPDLNSSNTIWRDDADNMAACVKAFSNNGIPVNSDIFPDADFRKYLSSNADTDSDGILSDEECAAVTQIDLKSYSVYSLKGIEYFTELTSLKISGQHIVSLDLSGNTKLTKENVSSYMCLRDYEEEFECSELDQLGIDTAKITNLTNAYIENGKLSPMIEEPGIISYRYDCGSDISVFIQINMKKGVTHNKYYSYALRGAASEEWHWVKCHDCGYLSQSDHAFEDHTSEDGVFKTKRCTLCGWITPLASHFDVDHDAESCQVCKHINGDGSAHSYGDWKPYSNNDIKPCHYQECFICGLKEYAGHEFGEYTDNGDGTHSRTCKVCGYVENAEHDMDQPVEKDRNFHTVKCTKCSCSEEVQHNWVPVQTAFPREGKHFKKCADCMAGLYLEPHSVEYVETENGKHRHICTFCKETLWDEHYYCYIDDVLHCSDEPMVTDDPDEHLTHAAPVFIAGDVNNDGRINVSDVVLFNRYFLGTTTLASWNNADLNEDDSINIYDIVMLKNQLLQT
ncbi:MAG: lectin like domain-containing protein [Oscillospiraceae bacterium]|nr:lectin like domain-containing protein [Oscillospiraceae bacterium]